MQRKTSVLCYEQLWLLWNLFGFNFFHEELIWLF